MSKERLETFSDGVFAIAITLLILTIAPPSHYSDLARQLGSRWPALAAYVVSFAVIGIMWLNHHTIFSHLDHIDRGLFYLNLALLMTIVFIPYPTGAFGEALRRGVGARTAAVFYTAVMASTTHSPGPPCGRHGAGPGWADACSARRLPSSPNDCGRRSCSWRGVFVYPAPRSASPSSIRTWCPRLCRGPLGRSYYALGPIVAAAPPRSRSIDGPRPDIRPRPVGFPPTRYELLTCGWKDHFLVGLDAADVTDADPVLVREHDGLRWHHCLRCGCWVLKHPPENPTRRACPHPRRGRAPPAGAAVARSVRPATHRARSGPARHPASAARPRHLLLRRQPRRPPTGLRPDRAGLRRPVAGPSLPGATPALLHDQPPPPRRGRRRCRRLRRPGGGRDGRACGSPSGGRSTSPSSPPSPCSPWRSTSSPRVSAR